MALFENLHELKKKFTQSGRIEWMGVRTEKFAPLSEFSTIELNTETGILKDHYKGRSGNRHVTLIQQEHLLAVASYLGKKDIAPTTVRRNIVVSGINLLALVGKTVRVGTKVVLEITGHCHPCSRMEKNLGLGGYNAMRGHGGITARVIKNGKINTGDLVEYLSDIEKKKD